MPVSQLVIKKCDFKIEDIDDLICEEVDRATSENSAIWTCPDYNRREYTHSFFQYPARMIPAVQKKLIEIIVEAKPDITEMIDPFMGSATTLVACMEMGLNCYGQDVNPLSILIAKARTGPYYISALKVKYEQLMKRVRLDKSTKIEADFPTIDKWFKPSIQSDLSKLVRAIRKEPRLAIRRFFWVVLAETIRLSSNDRTSTYKMHIRPEEEIGRRNFSAVLVFELHMDKSIEDFELHAQLLKDSNQLSTNSAYNSGVELRLWDSKESIFNPVQKPFYGLLVTSPPYGDNKTTVPYGQSSYLPLQWIDLKDIDVKATKDLLKSISEIDNRSLGGILKNQNQDKIKTILEKSPSFKKTYKLINETSADKLSKVVSFIIDLNDTIDNIFKVMKKNSYQIWTVGNRRVANIPIPNDKIIVELMAAKGGKLIKTVEREIINKRMAKRNNGSVLMTTEDILIFRKIG